MSPVPYFQKQVSGSGHIGEYYKEVAAGGININDHMLNFSGSGNKLVQGQFSSLIIILVFCDLLIHGWTFKLRMSLPQADMELSKILHTQIFRLKVLHRKSA